MESLSKIEIRILFICSLFLMCSTIKIRAQQIYNCNDVLFESNQDDTELNFSFDQRKFLKLIVKNNWSLAASIAEEFAKSEGKLLRAYIQELNQRAYKYIEDQLIVQDNDRIIVDEMYKDLVNRTLNAGD